MNKWEEFETKYNKLAAIQHAMRLIEFDLETGGPSGSHLKTGKTLGTLSAMYHFEMTDNGLWELLQRITEQDVTAIQWKMIKQIERDLIKLAKVPAHEYVAYAELVNESRNKWLEARNEDDFTIFAPYLQQIIDYQKKYIQYQGYQDNPYNALLDDYEQGLTVAELDQFFAAVSTQLVPFLQKVLASPKLQELQAQQLGMGFFSADKQRELAEFLLTYVGYDFTRGQLAESQHPFSTSMHNDDSRVTTHYYEDDAISSIFSVLHEFGHAIYELNISDELTQTPLGEGVSMGIHESQSRFYENIVGRDEAFWSKIYPVVQAFFPQPFAEIELTDFILLINNVQPNLIRIEADELTYPLHIMVRYDLEKMIFNDEITVAELPQKWDDLMEQYLGIRPTTMANGILQDIHWSQGSFGYFPTYALGSAYAAQFYHTMRAKLDFDTLLATGDIAPITDFLHEHIHQYGKSKLPADLIFDTTNEVFNAQYYIDYLINKYTKLFNVQ